MSEKIGIIGLGIMGSAYTKNLSAAGYEIIGFDVNEERFEAQGNARIKRASSPTDVVNQVDRVITSLPHPDALIAVADEISKSGKEVIIADTCTLKISDKIKARDILADKGITLLDCPVSGTGHQAWAGDLVIFGSGDPASFDKVKPAFEKMGREVHYLGEFGTGSKMKYIANLLVVIHNVSSAEAITYGVKAGIDPQLVYDVIKSSAGSSRMFEVRGQMMVDNKYDENVSANHLITKKDISVILDFADEMGCPTPLFSLAGDIHRAAIAQGRALEDTASVCAVTDNLAGVKRK